MIREAKKALRREILKKIGELPQSYIDYSDSVIREKLLACDEYLSAERIFAYCSIDREVDTREIISHALHDGKRVALPVSLPHGRMIFREISDFGHFTEGAYGIPEPDESCPEAEPRRCDIILVPALSADAEGNRLGHGAGYYDRFLERYDFLCSICLIRAELMTEHIPTEETDRRVSRVLNENQDT